MKKIKTQKPGRRTHHGENPTGTSPFGVNRHNRRVLFAAVRDGIANEQEVERFKSLGKEAYPWLGFQDVIEGMIKRSLKRD